MNILEHDRTLYIELDPLIEAIGKSILDPNTPSDQLPGREVVYRNLKTLRQQGQDNLDKESIDG